MTIDISTIYNRYQSSLFEQAFNITQDRFIAQDLVQAAIMYIFNKGIDGFNSIGKIEATLRLFIKCRALNYVIREKNKRKLRVAYAKTVKPYTSNTAFEFEAEEIILRRIYELVPSLSKQQQQIFNLKHFEELDYSDIAQRLNIAEVTVRVQYKRCVDFFIKHIRGNKKAPQ